MLLLFIITSFLLFSAAHADAQGRAAAAGSCDRPHMSGVATQQLMSGNGLAHIDCSCHPDTTDTSASR